MKEITRCKRCIMDNAADPTIRFDENGYCTEQKNYSGWVQEEGGWWFRRPDGSWPMAEWMEFNGEWYHFDDQGYVQSGWFEENGNRYWLDMYGKMLRDTEMVIDGIRYGFGPFRRFCQGG